MPIPNSKTILIAEDTAAIRTIITFLLRSRGFDVVESVNGTDALEKALALRPDLIVLDVMMPGLSGFEVCSYLKANLATHEIPILILTSVTSGTGKSDEHWKSISNADEFVSKPFKSHDLLFRIDRLLEQREATGSLEQRGIPGRED
jgi:chemotaxis family two-component system response regulator PixH